MLRCVNDYLHYISFFGRGQETNCELSVSINIEINPKAEKRGEQASALPTVQKFIMNDVCYLSWKFICKDMEFPRKLQILHSLT